MSRRRPVDAHTVLGALVVPADGWAWARIAFGPSHPGQQGALGLVDARGIAWEVTRRWDAAEPWASKALKQVAEYVSIGLQSGYQYALLRLDGEHVLAERWRGGTALRVWDGIELDRGPWHDTSAGGCPWQYHKAATWTLPGGAGTERVTLYLRWRSWGIDPERALWQGHVVRADLERDPFSFLHASWSPNLLPLLAPCDAPPPAPPLKLFELFSAASGQAPDVGFTEDQFGKARQALVERAETWLRTPDGPPWIETSRPHETKRPEAAEGDSTAG